MGLKILITEMDVADNSLPADIPERDHAIAEIYEQYPTPRSPKAPSSRCSPGV